MGCETWIAKLDAYLDGELPADEARAVYEHVRGCGACAAEILSRVQLKRAITAAGQKFAPDPLFRARIQNLAARRSLPKNRLWAAAFAGSAVLLAVIVVFAFMVGRRGSGDRRLLSELADLHVASLASTNRTQRLWPVR